MDVSGMKDGDVAGLCVTIWICYVGVKIEQIYR